MKTKLVACLMMGMMMMGCLTAEADKPQKAKNNSERCEATTTKNERCKLKKIAGQKYCSVHIGKDNSAKPCKATTQAGTQCKRTATKNGYCQQHYKMKKEGKLKN